jgi:hypothetical protein
VTGSAAHGFMVQLTSSEVVAGSKTDGALHDGMSCQTVRLLAWSRIVHIGEGGQSRRGGRGSGGFARGVMTTEKRGSQRDQFVKSRSRTG